jgi:hypothetical protein
MDEKEQNERTSRSRFLRQLGVTLAAAVGAGALAARAKAFPGDCCYDCGCGGCTPPQGGSGCYCWCDCSGIGQSYCLQHSSGCVSQGCTICAC